MSYPSYEELHKAVYNFLPEKLTNGSFVLEYLNPVFDSSLVNFDPYKEILPTYYSWHKISDKNSDCTMHAGANHTAKLLQYIPKNNEQQLLPDVIIAVYAHDMCSPKNTAISSECLAVMKNYESYAKKSLKEQEYPTWHHTCKSYLPTTVDYLRNNQVLDMCDEGEKVTLLADHMVTTFMEAFSSYTVIFHGYAEDCYKAAEEYKLSKYNLY